eukprot:m.206131 g.206131  ORF g.206131 m.206131 type:complete len:62 (+) comp32941_c0_seq1:1402-1587(+)
MTFSSDSNRFEMQHCLLHCYFPYLSQHRCWSDPLCADHFKNKEDLNHAKNNNVNNDKKWLI